MRGIKITGSPPADWITDALAVTEQLLAAEATTIESAAYSLELIPPAKTLVGFSNSGTSLLAIGDVDGRLNLRVFDHSSQLIANAAQPKRDFAQSRFQELAGMLSQRPYRQYYLYPSPAAQHGQVLPQILSIYAITFYLGSIVRYRPHHFDEILKGDFGPFIETFLNDQPTQFLYLMASEFAQREVTRAAIV